MSAKRPLVIGTGNRTLIFGTILTVIFVGAAFFAQVSGTNPLYATGVGAILALGGTVLASRLISLTVRRAQAIAEEFAESGDAQVLMHSSAAGELSPLLQQLGSAVAEQHATSRFFRNALKSLRNPVLVTSREGKILAATNAVMELVKKPATQVLGFTPGQVFENKKGTSVAGRALRSKKAVDEQSVVNMWDGREVTLRQYASTIVDADGEVQGVVCSYIDLHSLIEKQKELESQKAEMLEVGQEVSLLAQRVASASEELSASADEQARGAQRQKEQTDTVAAAMEEMTATVLEVARNASATSAAADGANESAREGVDMVGKAVDAIHEVSQSAEKLSGMIHQLDSQAGEIGRIISVINDIADQTNLLALNAAIEAARAGDAGRGFAVVADEVRKLAEKTMTATKEVENAIKTIQERSRLAMTSMDETGEQVVESTQMANQAGRSLEMIMGSIEDMVQRAAQIATAAEEQSSAAEEINHSIEGIAQVAAEADEGAGQTASATRDLAQLSQELLGVALNFSEEDTERPRLRASEHDMKGVLPKLMQDFAREKKGERVFTALQKELGDPVFLPTGTYPDQVFRQMAEVVAEATGGNVRDVFLELGRYTMRKFHEMYPRYFKDEDLKRFLLRMNELHEQLTKAQPGIKPPSFTFEDKGDRLFMNYRSERGFFDYFEGILQGAAEFKGERIDVVVTPLTDHTARAEIRFL
ncbi:methyl-accepting chemotaxis sensory transducer with Pas/Pac sensor [Paucidesulfovibrio gracilis DSM 16080]|uniref:Methyl-accepting chemotaxis sensory transducer with Pas/Pac sensor n=1 Tax=Paucidesulfovibrio gracilis DSM 16080 TaxID=1121449 RepID=A0A1T4WS96_9BACT|nr:methyl-accepting chemotaxis protein [Paucidesulfovibrio gracilis]SKA80243.1 methyl-accepting chemotaxis sensory transducer with Pas/Pac sensor [Paucidesulfovibrio gracilis DSM 16080]